MKEKLTVNLEKDIRDRARYLSEETRISISEILELLISGTSEEEILEKYYEKKHSE